jgi:hypothetical protein
VKLIPSGTNGFKYFNPLSETVTTLLHFAKENVPILPIHGSFIMRKGYEETLSEVMAEALKARTGSDIPIKVTAKPVQAKRDRTAHQATRGVYKDYEPSKKH